MTDKVSTIKHIYDRRNPVEQIQIISNLLELGIMNKIEIKLMLGIKVTSLELALYGLEKNE